MQIHSVPDGLGIYQRAEVWVLLWGQLRQFFTSVEADCLLVEVSVLAEKTRVRTERHLVAARCHAPVATCLDLGGTRESLSQCLTPTPP